MTSRGASGRNGAQPFAGEAEPRTPQVVELKIIAA